MPATALTTDPEQALVDDIVGYADDPLGFVRYAFPWGEPGPLADQGGPDEWQAEFLTTIRDELARRRDGDINTAIQIAIASGHGIGKTAELVWLILWFLSTRPHPQVVATANTQTQLSSKTWRELAKWHKLAINGHWFGWTATKFYLTEHPETWFASAIPWSMNNAEAFAGTHEKHVLVIYDEASAIADVIWEVTEGAMTTPGAMWVAFGNPTKNTGRFRECWGEHARRWITRQIDSRTAKMANRAQIDQWVEDYGEDSDFVRVRVKGEFPRAGDNQFIASDAVTQAQARELEPRIWAHYPKILGVDVARFGDDTSVIIRRQGMKVWAPKRFRELDLMELVAHVADEMRDFQADAVAVDGVGLGAGVVDRLRQLNYRVIDVQSSHQASDPKTYANLRAELWGRMRDWVRGEVDLAPDKQLRMDMTAPEYGFNAKMQIQLEKKDDMRRRGQPSPDSADALAMTFADFARGGNSKARPIQRRSARGWT